MRNLHYFYSMIIICIVTNTAYGMRYTRVNRVTSPSSHSMSRSAPQSLHKEARRSYQTNIKDHLVRYLYPAKKDRPIDVCGSEALLLEGSEKSKKYPRNEDWTDLHEYAYKGNNEHLKKLIDSLAKKNISNLLARSIRGPQKIDTKDRYDQTPLWWAAANGKCEAAELLLKAGANVNAADIWGRTPLHTAASSAGPSMVRLLLMNDAKIDAKDSEGGTPLHAMTDIRNYVVDDFYDRRVENHARNAHVILSSYLLRPYSSRLLKIRDNEGATPIDRAAKNNHLMVLSACLSPEYVKSDELPIKEIMESLSDYSIIDLLRAFKRFERRYKHPDEFPFIFRSKWKSIPAKLNNICHSFEEMHDDTERCSWRSPFLRKEMMQLDEKTIQLLFYAHSTLLEFKP